MTMRMLLRPRRGGRRWRRFRGLCRRGSCGRDGRRRCQRRAGCPRRRRCRGPRRGGGRCAGPAAFGQDGQAVDDRRDQDHHRQSPQGEDPSFEIPGRGVVGSAEAFGFTDARVATWVIIDVVWSSAAPHEKIVSALTATATPLPIVSATAYRRRRDGGDGGGPRRCSCSSAAW